MKKIFITLIFALIFCCTSQVNAACAAGANIGNESVCLVKGSNTKISDGTAYAEDSTLVLNNYNGGNISYFMMQDPVSTIKIKLIGDNYIKASDSYGILIPKTGIEFIGNGTLTIESKLSFAIVSDWYKYNTNEETISLNNDISTIKITAGNDDENDIDNKVENNTNENTTENNSDSNEMVLTVCCIICMVCTLSITILYLKNKKN